MDVKRKKLTNKIQVLLTDDDIRELNHIICKRAIEQRRSPEPISSLIRDLVKEYIEVNHVEQQSFIKTAVKQSTK